MSANMDLLRYILGSILDLPPSQLAIGLLLLLAAGLYLRVYSQHQVAEARQIRAIQQGASPREALRASGCFRAGLFSAITAIIILATATILMLGG